MSELLGLEKSKNHKDLNIQKMIRHSESQSFNYSQILCPKS